MKVLTVTRKEDDDGTPICLVPLENVDKEAILFLEDWNLLLSLGTDPRWTLSGGLVLARVKLPVARLITDAGVKEKVVYKDRNLLNLRRTNLVRVTGGSAQSNTREKLRDKPFRIRTKATLEYNDIIPDHINQLIKESLINEEI